MKKLFLAAMYSMIATWPVAAADMSTPKPAKVQPVKDTPAPVLTGTSGFWLGVTGGVGLSPTMNSFTIDGVQQGGAPIRGYPTGMLAGISGGYGFNSGPLYLGASADAFYDFSRGCVDIACVAARKNGFLLEQGLEIGSSISTMNGSLPAPLPAPNGLPTSLWSNLGLVARVGYAERNLDLCAVNGLIDQNGNEITECGSKFIAAPYAGLKAKFMASTNSEFSIRWDHIFWGNQYSFTPTAAVPLFQNSVNIKSEDLLLAGWAYHF